MFNRNEVIVTKEIIQKYSLGEKVRKDELKKLYVREGLSVTSASNYIFTLVALELIKEDDPFLLLDKKLFESTKKKAVDQE